ncbi:MAG: hypothetical protein FWC03_01010 [Treponema sp.]|nr:hypothetical protein [Treponema sp.]
MSNKSLFFIFFCFIFLLSCSGSPQPWNEGRWNIYGLLDPEQDVKISHFYDDYDPQTKSYKPVDLFWYQNADKDNISVDEFLESEAVYLGYTQDGIEFCVIGDMEGLIVTEKPSRTVIMKVININNFSKDLEKFTVFKIRYRYFFRPVYIPRNQVTTPVSNRRVSQAETYGLAVISEFFLDEYEIIGKLDVPQSRLSRGLQEVNRGLGVVGRGLLRAGEVLSALARGTDRAIGKLLGIDNFITQGEITLENGLTYQRVGMGEIVKKSLEYDGSDLLFTSRVILVGERGNNMWAFREAEGNLVHTMMYTGHIPANMKEIRIYYRFRNDGVFEIDEYKQASIFNDQW